MRNLITILAILLGLGASAQQTRLLTPDKYSDYGLVYALPNTAFEVEVTARHTVRQAGPFRQFAPKYVGTDNVITADAETWEITGVRLRTYGVANDSAIYRMQLKAGQALTLCVADDGMLDLSLIRPVHFCHLLFRCLFFDNFAGFYCFSSFIDFMHISSGC